MNNTTSLSQNRRVLISGGGIAGLSLGILLYEQGWDPLIIERDPALRTEGYITDIFGTGWDVAERMGIIDEIKSIRYPMDYLEYINHAGKPFISIPRSRISKAFGGKYNTLRRSDLERILFERARSIGLGVRFSTVVRSLEDTGPEVEVEFEDNSRDSFALVFGADGIHSRIRHLAFGPEEQFDRFLGAYVAAFHTANKYGINDSIKFFEEIDHLMAVYPITDRLITTIYVFRQGKAGFVPPEERLPLVRNKFKSAGWISQQILSDIDPSALIFLDALTQIVMPSWSKGRIALLGDACGCLTFVAGQGSHMAMGGAYVITHELERHHGEHRAAFSAYEKLLQPVIRKKQAKAASFVKIFIPSASFQMWPRRIAIRLLFSRPFIGFMPSYFGSKSILNSYNI